MKPLIITLVILLVLNMLSLIKFNVCINGMSFIGTCDYVKERTE